MTESFDSISISSNTCWMLGLDNLGDIESTGIAVKGIALVGGSRTSAKGFTIIG
jgi:hypothetical protein